MFETVQFWVGLIGGSLAILGTARAILRWLRARFLDPRRVRVELDELQPKLNSAMADVVNESTAPMYGVVIETEYDGVRQSSDVQDPPLDVLPARRRSLMYVHLPAPFRDDSEPPRFAVCFTDGRDRRWRVDPDGELQRLPRPARSR